MGPDEQLWGKTSTQPGRASLVAASYGCPKALAALLRAGADVEASCPSTGSVLHAACSSASVETVRVALAAGADAKRECNGMAALHYAAASGSAETVRAILAHGACDVNARTTAEPRWTALHIAAGKGSAEAVRALLDAGADANSASLSVVPETPLHACARAGAADVAQLLLSHGADKNAGRSRGHPTPLYIAAKEGHEGVVSALIKAGADPNAKVANRTALDVAADCVRLLIAGAAPSSSPDVNPEGVQELKDRVAQLEELVRQRDAEIAALKQKVSELESHK
eukprot:m51a1_g1769 hypothetical protein (284) ;mRNA; f:313497-314485